MKQIWFVRHGESESNAGAVTAAPHSTPITERGRVQADRLLKAWGDWSHGEPDLIATSPYVRTEMTAAPFLARYPRAARVTWPIHEFTQLTPDAWKNTTHAERLPQVQRYWEMFDPKYVDGHGADSFDGFIDRVRCSLHDAAESPYARIVCFTHNHVVHAALWLALFAQQIRGPIAHTPEEMQRFYALTAVVPVANTAVLPMVWDGVKWMVGRLRLAPEG